MKPRKMVLPENKKNHSEIKINQKAELTSFQPMVMGSTSPNKVPAKELLKITKKYHLNQEIINKIKSLDFNLTLSILEFFEFEETKIIDSILEVQYTDQQLEVLSIVQKLTEVMKEKTGFISSIIFGSYSSADEKLKDVNILSSHLKSKLDTLKQSIEVLDKLYQQSNESSKRLEEIKEVCDCIKILIIPYDDTIKTNLELFERKTDDLVRTILSLKMEPEIIILCKKKVLALETMINGSLSNAIQQWKISNTIDSSALKNINKTLEEIRNGS